MPRSVRSSLLCAACACSPLLARAAGIDYAQADASSSATTVVLVRAASSSNAAAPAPLWSATYARWSTGSAASVGYVHRWAIARQPHHWVLGAGIGANVFDPEAAGGGSGKSALSARAQSEWMGPAPAGSYYALVQASSFRRGWLATAQYSPAAFGIAPEWTRYHEQGYQATSIGLRVATGVPRWFLRLGVTRAEGRLRPFAGAAYNGF